MFWVILIAGGLFSALALLMMSLWIIGGRLPAAHEASASVRLGISPEALFEVVTDRDRLLAWRSDLKRVEPLDPIEGKPAWREIGKYGTLEQCAVEVLPPTTVAEGRYVTRTCNSDAPFGGTWTWIFAPDGAGGCRLTVTEHGIIRGRIVRAMAHHLMGVDATIHAVLGALRRHVAQA